MIASLSVSMRTRLTLAAIGLVQGFVYYLAYEFWPDGVTGRAFFAAAIFFVSGLALTVQLCWTGKDIGRLLGVAVIGPCIFAVLAIWVWLQVPVGDVPYRFDDARTATLIFSSALTFFLITPFTQAFVTSGRRSYPYEELFRRFWDNLFIVAAGAVIVWAFWAIILLWSELFKLIDVTIFEDVFTDEAFICMSLTTVFGYSIALAREWDKLTTTLRTVTLTVLKALMPLLAGIALLFLVSLPFTGLQPLWDTRHASATLLALIALEILFFNAAYQGGEGEPPYSRWSRHLVEAALVTIPVYVLITFYALYLRINQYGLTFGRFYGVLFAAAGMLCGLGYAAAVFKRRGEWMEDVRLVNMRMTWVVVVFALLAHTPLLDPLRWSAHNQYGRLVRGAAQAADFDFGYLRFQLGHVGYETLERIEALSDHPEAAIIIERIAATRAAESYDAVRPQPETLLNASDLTPVDSMTALPDSLVRYIVTHLTQYQADDCEDTGECAVFTVDLDADDENEYVLVLAGDQRYEMLAYDLDTQGKWTQVGRLRPAGSGVRLPPRTTFLESIRRGGFLTEELRYRDLVIGELRLRLVQ